MKTHLINYYLTLILLLAGVSGCKQRDTEGNQISPSIQTKAPKRVNVEVLKLTPQSFSYEKRYLGQLTPLKRFSIKSELEGLLELVSFEAGSKVHKGEVLVKISTKQLTVKRNQALSNLKLSQSSLERDQKLFDKQLISNTRLEQAHNQMKLHDYSLQQAEIDLEKSVILSPTGGVVSMKNVEIGNFVNKGQLIGEVINIQQLKVVLHIPEQDLHLVKASMPVEVHINSNNTQLSGTVHKVGWEADPQTQSFPVEVLIENPELLLRVGMQATIQIILTEYQNQILIPRYAILEHEKGPMVYVVEKGIAHTRFVKLGHDHKEHVQVLEGLSLDDHIVVSGQGLLSENTFVDIQNETTD